ncbi:flavin reductase [Actinomadura sp. KC06]|nr:flavin reductase [Actinomadura sp. KC06]
MEIRTAGSGSPIIKDVVAWIDCDLESVQDAGDHYIVLGRVRELDVENPSLPLLFFQGGYGRFAPLSLAASSGRGARTQQLRQVDLVRAEMERLASDLSARCIATAAVDDEIIVLASAGSPDAGARATLVGVRLPFVPPNGSALAAWFEDAQVTEWLATWAPHADPTRTDASPATRGTRGRVPADHHDTARHAPLHLSRLADRDRDRDRRRASTAPRSTVQAYAYRVRPGGLVGELLAKGLCLRRDVSDHHDFVRHGRALLTIRRRRRLRGARSGYARYGPCGRRGGRRSRRSGRPGPGPKVVRRDRR